MYEDYEEAAARWRARETEHAARFPEHRTKRDATMGGHTYCVQCQRYITR